jgi:glycosyltransferase involved in cell wall biosynthesis
MNTPLLSICIPTYNRSGYLKRALESLRIQLADSPSLQELVEVVVSDNCSTDDTGIAAESFRQHFKHFNYVRNEKNVGFDLNILNVVKSASGTYCWYLGDDDVIVNGALEFICAALKDGKHDFIGVNAEHLPEDESHKVKRTISPSSLVTETDFNEFYFKNYCEGAVSVLIFDKAMWMSLVDTNDFLDHWLYYETILRILVATKKPLAFVKEALIQTGQDCRWAENGLEVFTFGNSNLLLERMILFGFNKERVTAALESNSQKAPLIVLRAKGHDLKCNLKNLKYIYKTYKRTSFPRMVLITLIYFIPNSFVKFVRDSRKNMLSKNRAATGTAN